MQTINQISKEVIKKVVHFNTKFRDSYYNSKSSNFKYNFPLPINNVLSTRLRSIDIPNTWYTFSEHIGNNKFEMKVSMAAKRVVEEERKTIIIPDGNYSSDDIVNYINLTYLHNVPGGVQTAFSYIKIDISQSTLKTTFCIVNQPEDVHIHYDIKFTNPKLKVLTCGLGWMLGFRYAEYQNNSECHPLVSEGLYNGGGDRYLYISLNDWQKPRINNNIIFLDKGFLDENIIGKIYLTEGKFYVNVSEDHSSDNLKKREYIGPVDINKIHLRLLDDCGCEIDLNHMDFSFSLEFEILYEKYQKNYIR